MVWELQKPELTMMGSSSPVSGQCQPFQLNSSCPLRCFSLANLILIVGNISNNSAYSTAQSTLSGLSLSIVTLLSFWMLPLILLALKNHWQMVVLETNFPVSWYRPCLYAWRVHWLFSRRILARTRPSLSDIDIDPLPWVIFFNLVFGSKRKPFSQLAHNLACKTPRYLCCFGQCTRIEGSLCGSALIISIIFCATLTFSSKGFVAPFLYAPLTICSHAGKGDGVFKSAFSHDSY